MKVKNLSFFSGDKINGKSDGCQTIMHLADGMTIVNLRTTTLKIGD
jgi:hypothetical protein